MPGSIAAEAAVVDQGLACLDQVSQWVDDFEAHATLPLGAAEDARAMAERLRALLPASFSKQLAAAGPPAATAAGALPQWVGELIDSAARANFGRAGGATGSTLRDLL